MLRRIALAVIGLLLVATTAWALEANGVLKQIDADGSRIVVFANGADRNLKIDPAARFLDEKGQPLAEGLKSSQLKAEAAVTITVEMGNGGPILKALQLGTRPVGTAGGGRPSAGGRPNNSGPPQTGTTSVGLKPLTEMTAQDRYKGEDGGLYGNGQNTPPSAHLASAQKETARIEPLDASGKPSSAGTIALVSISMSNATQEFSKFKQIADADPQKSGKLTIVDCAQGGQAMAQWVDPSARAWVEADRRLQAANVSPNQVQIAWIKLANVRPTGELSDHGRKLQRDTLAVIQNAKKKFPNLRIAYLGSRIYAGYAGTELNPEPYAYEGAFAVRWLIQDQMAGKPELNFDPARGAVKAPLLLWGPYFWGDGTTPRKADGLVWERADLSGDGTHPSEAGRQKVAEQLLKFFKTDEQAKSWFVKR